MRVTAVKTGSFCSDFESDALLNYIIVVIVIIVVVMLYNDKCDNNVSCDSALTFDKLMSKGIMEDDGTSRGVIRPAPAHIRTITTSGRITTVPNVQDGQSQQTRHESSNASDNMSLQLKVQQQRGEFAAHDG